MTRPWHNKQANNADIHTRLLLNEGAVTAMCKEKATCLRLRVKAEVMQTRDDPSDVSKITDESNLTAPPIWKGERAQSRGKALEHR